MLDKLRKQCQQLHSTDVLKYTTIENILNYDYCFFEMDITTAYSILRDLHVSEKNLKKVYLELLKKENFND